VADYVKLHTDILDNPKFERIPADLIKPWLKCLVIARLYGGVLPDLQTVAYRLRVDQATAATWLSRLQKGHFLEPAGQGGDLQPHDWEYWNPPDKRDSQNAERQRRFRAKRAAERNVTDEKIPPDPPKTNTTQLNVTSVTDNVTKVTLRNGVTKWPTTTTTIRAKYPGTDDAFIENLARLSMQALIGAGLDPEGCTDDVLAASVSKCTTSGQRSAGLYPRTVPQCVVTMLTKSVPAKTPGMELAEKEYQVYTRKFGESI
jgi:hypothetical protein